MLIMDSTCRRRAVRCSCVCAGLVGWVGRVGVLLVVLAAGLGALGTCGDKLIVRIILWLSWCGVGACLWLFAPSELIVLLRCWWVLLCVQFI